MLQSEASPAISKCHQLLGKFSFFLMSPSQPALNQMSSVCPFIISLACGGLSQFIVVAILAKPVPSLLLQTNFNAVVQCGEVNSNVCVMLYIQ